MKRVLLVGSLMLAFIIVGCSDKANVESDQNSMNTASSNSDNNNGSDNSTMSGSMSDMDSNSNSNSDMNNQSSGSSDALKSIYFKFDKFNIDGDNLSILKSNSNIITSNSFKEVKIEGNTDEWGSDEYNYALALKRASSAKDALISNGVSSNIIKLVSYGESKPKCLDKTKKCWQENRRVDFVTK